MRLIFPGESGHFEVYRDPDATNGATGLCELQRDQTCSLPHYHMDHRTQELGRQEGRRKYYVLLKLFMCLGTVCLENILCETCF